MHPDDAKRNLNSAIASAISLIHDVLGDNEDLVLLTEGREMNLCLTVERSPSAKRKITYCVTDGIRADYTGRYEFDSLPDAKAFYQEVRAAGSWSEYYKDHPESAKKARVGY